MPAWRLRRNDTIPAQIPHVNNPHKLCIQDDSKVDILLRHNEQRGIKFPFLSNGNIKRTKSYRLTQLRSVLLSPPNITLRTPAHTLLLELVYPPTQPILPTNSRYTVHMYFSNQPRPVGFPELFVSPTPVLSFPSSLSSTQLLRHQKAYSSHIPWQVAMRRGCRK